MERINYAVLYAAAEPPQAVKDRLLALLSERHGTEEIRFVRDASAGDGFRIRAGSVFYDWTNEGRLQELKKVLAEADDSPEPIALMREKIEEFRPDPLAEGNGITVATGDSVAEVSGLSGAFYGEIIRFENGVKGMALNLGKKDVGCILFGGASSVSAGDRAACTGKVAGIPVGGNFLGRVINALGEPLDGLGEIEAEDYYPAFRPAPGIIDREKVNTPLETGILAIDTMFPIGRGQRELIIGDRATGKTSIAVDTIVNQKGKGVVCIYVAIGQKASFVAGLYAALKERSALDYTCIVSAPASESAPMQYIAPYAATSLAEYFMNDGRDVLIVYDDLSKHAVAYREMSLLLGRAPGREAYPGDIFYLHSRLLERSAHLKGELGGGSITALPIVETQAGDVSAYIPTNVISITDGQLFLETDLFASGRRPAINTGLSVSRVGGDAQSKAVKKVGGELKLLLARYEETASFTRFSGETDAGTAKLLAQGRLLESMLVQKRYSPVERADIVFRLICALNGGADGVSADNLPAFFDAVAKILDAQAPQLRDEIETKGTLPEGIHDLVLSAAKQAAAEL